MKGELNGWTPVFRIHVALPPGAGTANPPLIGAGHIHSGRSAGLKGRNQRHIRVKRRSEKERHQEGEHEPRQPFHEIGIRRLQKLMTPVISQIQTIQAKVLSQPKLRR